MSTQDHTNTETAQQELREIALLLKEHADAEDTSLAELIRQYPALGSDKTFGLICKGHFDELKADKWLDAYRAVRDSVSDSDDADPLYEDLSTARLVRGQITRLKLSRTNAKLVIVEGYTGAGKTSTAKIIATKYNGMTATQQVYTIEASAGWGDRPNAMLTAMLKALGRGDGGRSQAARLDKLCDVLAERPVMFIIDEVHDFGVRCLRVVKTILNATPTKIILLAHPRLFKNLERENWDDLSQLTGNRLLARIHLGTLAVDDVETILKRRLPLPGLNGDLKDAAKLVADAALNNGNLAFVREVAVRLIKAAKKIPLNLAAVQTAVRKEIQGRKPESVKLAA